MEGLPEWKRIKPVFDKWNDILENQVTFTLEDSEKHTGAHCRRVMLYALAIAQRQGLPEEDKDILGLLRHFMIPDGRMTGWMLDMDSVRQIIIGNIVYPMNWSLNRSAMILFIIMIVTTRLELMSFQEGVH